MGVSLIKEGENMNKWEYCQIVWAVATITKDEAEKAKEESGEGEVVINSDGTAMYKLGFLTMMKENSSPSPINDVLITINNLGREGWDLVSHTELHDRVTREKFIFKRQL
jgi:hypothetical protein